VIGEAGLENPDFRPLLGTLVAELRRDPKRFPKKSGVLSGVRAAPLRFRGRAWRAVFRVDERHREVHVVSIGPHDAAYQAASRRL
jgi:mRNA-degrading endonuclease RelE of RelBE toxin-antitoxin system